MHSVDYSGVVPEKFDVVKLSHLVDAEYGNQGLDFKLLNREGFAWTNCMSRFKIARWNGAHSQRFVPPIASFQIGLHFLTTGMRRAVATLTSVSSQLSPAQHIGPVANHVAYSRSPMSTSDCPAARTRTSTLSKLPWVESSSTRTGTRFACHEHEYPPSYLSNIYASHHPRTPHP